LRRQGDEEAARGRFLKALEVARQQGTRGFGLRAATSFARQLMEQGRPDEARLLLERTLGELRPSAAPDFDDAVGLLRALGGSPGPRPSG
jgi:hypothetical protein